MLWLFDETKGHGISKTRKYYRDFYTTTLLRLVIPWICVEKPEGVFGQGEHSSDARKRFLVPFGQEVLDVAVVFLCDTCAWNLPQHL